MQCASKRQHRALRHRHRTHALRGLSSHPCAALPAGLDDTGDVASECHFANLGACQAELTECATRPTRDLAAITLTCRVGVAWKLLQTQTRSHALVIAELGVVHNGLELRVFLCV